MEEGDDAVPSKAVDPEQGIFDSRAHVNTAGDEFLTIKDLVAKVKERQTENLKDLEAAKGEFADDTFVFASSPKLEQPLAGFLGRGTEEGLNADGPAAPSRASGNGLNDLFVPVGSPKKE